MPLSSVRSCVAADMSMPSLPSVSVLPALIATGPAGPAMRIPDQLKFAPSRTVLAEVTFTSHSATSPAPGTFPRSHEFGRLRSSKLSALVIVSAWAAAEKSAIEAAQMSGRHRFPGEDA
jgi:hypothetical protein